MLQSIFESCVSSLAFAIGLICVALIAIGLEKVLHFCQDHLGEDSRRLFSILRTTALAFAVLDCGVLSWFACTTAIHAVGLA
jgi:hypothetical protein